VLAADTELVQTAEQRLTASERGMADVRASTY
jgi:hypothetical protein